MPTVKQIVDDIARLDKNLKKIQKALNEEIITMVNDNRLKIKNLENLVEELMRKK